jgi:hypothetical protein
MFSIGLRSGLLGGMASNGHLRDEMTRLTAALFWKDLHPEPITENAFLTFSSIS